MDVLAAYKVGITVLIPVFSAITCGALVALSLRDCLSQEERRLKKIMLIYLSLSALGWYMTFCEAYFRNEKPWLDPACKIADLVEVFDVNRTALSGFINRTYGMNFNRYLNSWRMKELDRLRLSPRYSGKSNMELVLMAGFGNYRNYLRVKKGEDRLAQLKVFE